jgi:hypothetical protein
MHEQWSELLPFYVAGALSAVERAAVDAHLAECATCREAVEEWRIVAGAVRADASARAGELPPLWPVVRTRLRRRPTIRQALRAAVDLVWAQRVVVMRGGVVPAVLLVVGVGVWLTTRLPDGSPVALPLLTLVPVAAALGVAFLCGPDTDTAFEIVTTTPTSPATLVFARLTLVLGLVSGVTGLGSLWLSAMGGGALGPLVGAWLGPMLLLSALATLLSLLWQPIVAASVTLALWAGVVILLNAELDGNHPLSVSLLPLLHPGWLSFGVQIAVAGLLWLLAYVLSTREATILHKLELG